MITWGRVYWSVALSIAAIAFLIPEVIAIFTNMGNTLSEYARSELGLTYGPHMQVHHTITWTLTLIAWWVFVGVITWHIWFNVNPT